jgi:hypothetical protein
MVDPGDYFAAGIPLLLCRSSGNVFLAWRPAPANFEQYNFSARV